MHYELGFYEKTFAINCFRGILTFQLRYDFIHRVLMLHVMKANHLPSPVNFLLLKFIYNLNGRV